MIRAALSALALVATAASADPDPFPVALGGPFELHASDGTTRTQTDPDGRHQMLFFGYASCAQICSAALPSVADAVRALQAEGRAIRPLMITVDPKSDTVETMGPGLARHHPDFLGLTGTEAALQTAYDAFGVEREFLFTDASGIDIYAHGSFLYLLSPDGEVLTMMPPVMAGEQVAAIARRYMPDP